MDCCDLRLTFGQLARHIQTCPFNFGQWQKRTLFCGDTAGTMVPCSVWLSDERLDWGFWPHFWTDDGHLVLDPVEYILCTHFTLYFVYRIRRVSQKIRSYQHYNIIFHNFHQFPSIFQPFRDTMVFSIPFQRFPTSKVALMHRPTRAIGGSKSTPCLGARDMGRILFAQNEI